MIQALQQPRSSNRPRGPSRTSIDTACTAVSSGRTPTSVLHGQRASNDAPNDSARGPPWTEPSTSTTLQVIVALEALHACPFPSSSSLAAKLLCRAATPLNTATHTSLSTVGSSALSSAICSLVIHFSAKHHDLVAALSGQEASRVPTHHSGARVQQPHSSRSEFRTARRLAERYLLRMMATWCARVKRGRVRSSITSRALARGHAPPLSYCWHSTWRAFLRTTCSPVSACMQCSHPRGLDALQPCSSGMKRPEPLCLSCAFVLHRDPPGSAPRNGVLAVPVTRLPACSKVMPHVEATGRLVR